MFLATRELWLRSHAARKKVIYLIFDEKSAEEKLKRTDTKKRIQGYVALFCVLICLVFTVLFLIAEYTVVAPAVAAGMPCGCHTGRTRTNNTNVCCHHCYKDPLCLKWSDSVLASGGLAAICPPGAKAGDPMSTPKNTGFSCAADGFWMLVTTIFCLAWFIILKCRPPSTPAKVASPVPGTASA